MAVTVVVDYMMATGYTPEQLADSVVRNIDRGWQPVGPVVVQPMSNRSIVNGQYDYLLIQPMHKLGDG